MLSRDCKVCFISAQSFQSNDIKLRHLDPEQIDIDIGSSASITLPPQHFNIKDHRREQMLHISQSKIFWVPGKYFTSPA